MYALLKSASKLFRTHVFDSCNLETPDYFGSAARRDKVMVMKDGGLMSMIQVRGSWSYMGDEEFSDTLNEILKNLKATLAAPGLTLEIYFSRDPEAGAFEVRKSIKAMSLTASRLGLGGLQGIIQERGEIAARDAAAERTYLVIRTHPAALRSKSRIKEAYEQRARDAAELGLPLKPGDYSQSPLMAIGALRDTHNAICQQIRTVFSRFLDIVELDALAMLRAIAFTISPSDKSPEWKPRFADSLDAVVRTVKESRVDHDVSHLFAPDLGMQLFDKVPDCSERRGLVRYGSTYHAPLLVELAQETPTPIGKLLENIDPGVPFSLKVVIRTGSSAARNACSQKATAAGLLALFGAGNRQIAAGARSLVAYADEKNATLANIQMVARTWAKTIPEASARSELLMQALQSWGSLAPIEEYGDEIEAFLNNLPAVSHKISANSFPAQLSDVFTMLPLSRPASPWEFGTQLYRTPESTIFPYLPGSSKQTTSNDLYYAPPGFGKSVKLIADNLSSVLAPGQRRLPRIGLIDIGYGSAPFIEMLKASLPPDRKHEVVHVSYQMTERFARNPFDTPLGCRAPLKYKRSFLVNLMTELLTPVSGSRSIERLDELVGVLVDEMYSYFDPSRNPTPYEQGVDQVVDSALADIRFYVEDHAGDETPWWTVVDKLFEAGRTREASLAQRYAVPTLSQATEVLTHSNTIRDLFSSKEGDGSRDLVKFIRSMITTAVNDFPVLAHPTAFDFANARVVALDLQDVADSGSPQADKKTTIMYMLARDIVAGDFYESKHVIAEFPLKYRDYHAKRIADGQNDIKILEMDEFHRTAGSPQVIEMAVRDMREGRKHGVGVKLVSQLLGDFTESMIALSTNIFILSRGGSEDDAAEISRLFKPGRSLMDASRSILTGPGPKGSSMIYLGRMKGQRESSVRHLLYLPLGSQELWAYSTTPSDAKLRALAVEEFGITDALRRLARCYPGGSAAGEIEKLLEAQDIGEALGHAMVRLRGAA